MGAHAESNPFNTAVVMLFGEPTTAIWISLALWLGCAWIIVRNYRLYHRPTTVALNERLSALDPVAAAAGPDGNVDDAQAAFAQHFESVSEGMRSGGMRADELRSAWNQFRETILDESETPMRATARADGYFLHLSDDARVLAWWANIFVALGLTFTFLGIIAALTRTSGMLSPTGGGDMNKALITLLQITSVKFWTSVAGVVASIVLRAVDRSWHQATQRRLERVIELLDLGTLFSPPQRFAAAQLREAEEQTKALKTFSHDLALAIGEKLEAQMVPMTAAIGGLQDRMGSALGGIQSSIDDFKSGGFDQIGREFSDALSRQAGGEMQALAGALTTMTDKLGGVNDTLAGSSQAAADQIAGAARDFLTASEAIGRAFTTLNDRITAMGDRIVEQSNAAAERAGAYVAEEREAYRVVADEQRRVAREGGEALVEAVRETVAQASKESAAGVRAALGGFAEANAGIQASFDAMQGRLADMGDAMTRGGEAAASRNAELLGRAAAALEQATARAGSGMTAAVDAAVAKASDESARVMTAAFDRFGERFGEASNGLVDTLRQTAGRMEALASGIERFAKASEEHATRITQAGQDTISAATALSRAANDVQGAAVPIRTATEAISTAVTRAGDAAGRQAEAASAHQAAVTTISDRLAETSGAATRAWTDYRDRFEGVDAALAGALDGIKGHRQNTPSTSMSRSAGSILRWAELWRSCTPHWNRYPICPSGLMI